MPTCGLLIGVVLLAGQVTPPTLDLTASTTRPFIGQELTLTLQIDLPPGPPATTPVLSIPWLEREFGFHWSVPPAEWLRQQVKRSAGIEVRIAGRDAVIRLEPVPNKPSERPRHQLVWKLVVAEPDMLSRGVIGFAPVRLTVGGLEATTRPLTLEVQKLPLRPADLPRLFLGVGDLRLEARLSTAEVDSGGVASLTLHVRGGGAAHRIDRPKLAEVWPADVQDSVRIEIGAAKAEPDGRSFEYVLHPRRPGPLTLPAIRYADFDPDRGLYVAHETLPLNLIVRTPKAEVTKTQAPYANGEVPERLQAIRIDVSALEPRVIWPWYALTVALLVIPPALFFCRWFKRRQWFPEAWGTERHRWSAAAARAARSLRALDGVAAEPVAAILCGYLRERFALATRELTPVEAFNALQAAGLDGGLTTRVADLMTQLAVERFGPGKHEPTDLPARARELIRQLDSTS